MRSEQNEAVVRRYFEEVWNRGNLAVIDEVISPAFEGGGEAISGQEAVRLYVQSYRELFPHVHFTLLSLTSRGDCVAAAWLGQGMSSGEDIEDAGAITTTGVSTYRLQDGLIAEIKVGAEPPLFSRAPAETDVEPRSQN